MCGIWYVRIGGFQCRREHGLDPIEGKRKRSRGRAFVLKLDCTWSSNILWCVSNKSVVHAHRDLYAHVAGQFKEVGALPDKGCNIFFTETMTQGQLSAVSVEDMAKTDRIS